MNYPNLELLDYKVQLYLKYDKNWFETYRKVYKQKYTFNITSIVLVAEMFKQTFPNTACLNDNDDGVFCGQAFTDAYITIFYEPLTNIYVVCCNNEVVYKVEEPTETFLKDLKDRKLATLSLAKEIY